MAVKAIRDLDFPDRPEILEIRVANKWHARGNIHVFSYLFVDINGDGIEATGNLEDEEYLDRIVEIQSCYRVSKYTTVKAKTYMPVVPHHASVKIARTTVFLPIDNTNIPIYCFNFLSYEELQSRLPKQSQLTDFIGRADEVSDMLPIQDKTRTRTMYLRRLMIQDERRNVLQLTLWEDQGRVIDRESTLNSIIAVTATIVSEFQRRLQLSSTNATKTFTDPPIPDLAQIINSFHDIPAIPHITSTTSSLAATIEKLTVTELLTRNHPEFSHVQFTCEATIIEIQAYRSWYYTACNHCQRGVNQEKDVDGRLVWRCMIHGTMNEPNLLFAVNTIIADNTGSAHAVFYNNAMQQLLGVTCQHLVVTEGHNNPKILPTIIRTIRGEPRLLQVEVKPDSSLHVNKIVQADTHIGSPILQPSATLTSPSLQQQQTMDPLTPARPSHKRPASETSESSAPPPAKEPKNDP